MMVMLVTVVNVLSSESGECVDDGDVSYCGDGVGVA